MTDPDLVPPPPTLSLRVGVTGHRPRPGRPLDKDAVRKTCASLFSALETRLLEARGAPYGQRRPVLTLVTSLAEGSDQLATEAFMRGQADPGVRRRLEAVLPFALDDYAATFDDVEAARALRPWLEQADSVLELADWRPPVAAEPDARAAYRRDARYATVGEIAVRQADLLIAVWDGEPARGRGGTADNIAVALRQGAPVVLVDPGSGAACMVSDLPPFGDLFALVDARRLALTPERLTAALESVIQPPSSQRAGLEDEAPSKALAAYLAETAPSATWVWTAYDGLLLMPARRREARERAAHARSPVRAQRPLPTDGASSTLANPQWAGFPDGWLRPVFEEEGGFLTAWAAADRVATFLGHVYRSTYVAVFLLSALAVVVGLLGLLAPAFKGLFVVAELLCLIVAFALYREGRRRGHHERWLHSRELSEQFRAYWPLALLGQGGRRVMGLAGRWSAWLFNAYAADLGAPRVTATPGALKAAAEAVREAVVRDQIGYHKSNSIRLHHIHHRLEHMGEVALICAIFSAIILLAIWPWGCHGQACHPDTLRGWAVMLFTVLCGALPATGAAFAGLRYHGDFLRFSDRSADTRGALEKIDQALAEFIDACADPEPRPSTAAPLYETLAAIFGRLENVLLSDLEDWRFVYRARPGPEPG